MAGFLLLTVVWSGLSLRVASLRWLVLVAMVYEKRGRRVFLLEDTMRKRLKVFFETFSEAAGFASAKARELRRVVNVRRVGQGFDVVWWQDYVGVYDPIREVDDRFCSRTVWSQGGASASSVASMRSGEGWKRSLVERLQEIQIRYQARQARAQG